MIFLRAMQSNLLLRFTRNEFRLDTQSTIGVEFAYKQLIIDGKKIKTQVWVNLSLRPLPFTLSALQDTAGQERFKTVIPQFYRGSEGALAVFDLTKSDSFNHISTWIEEVHRHTPADLPIVLVGNKSDLVDQRQVTREQATSLAQQLNVSYMETSALSASNVEQAFSTLVTSIFRRKLPKSLDNSVPSDSSGKSVSIDDTRTRTVPDPSDSEVRIESTPTSFRVRNEQNPTPPKKGGCC